jgi:hypothetical protein
MTNPRFWLRPRFGLRELLLAFTAFAIGFPIWYRWPYVETVTERGTHYTSVCTWQRQWGGGRRKHGIERQILDGHTISVTTYRSDQCHGPCEFDNLAGHRITGNFDCGLKAGIWTEVTNGQSQTTFWERGEQEQRKPSN